jgi:type IV secretion system protein VirB3
MQMSESNAGLIADALFVGATRPPMRWGVTYAALLFNMVFTMEAFLLTKNLPTLLLAARRRFVLEMLDTVLQQADR